MVTNCIRNELRKIGDAVSGASLIAKRFQCVRCSCQSDQKVKNCVMSQIGENNASHYAVATQDPNLRKALRAMGGVPLLFIVNGKIILEHPSKETMEAARRREMAKCAPSDYERKVLKRIAADPTDSADEPPAAAPA
eukprot:CAMPEP_0113698352 /NCGR_PEP_ID=MMETSP0038_2-20120614/22661_1 /TAXON_ID=2898 /ORGANISM="Cryptomonas paramecium" /LENGTH=136 /DNA_ID=CAMNT_0000621503 /DNA_START=164 /DNA_END=570 /DNA_ORIENTATION=- /assembly_acc=CAM_ASM_000170